MAIFGVIVMLIFIVPIFEKMFSDFGGQLPWPTQLLVTLSPIALWSSPVLVISAIVFRSWWTNHKNDVSVRKIIDPFKLKIPIFGNLFTKIAIARFSRNFSSMIGAGVPIMQSLAVVGQTSGNLSVEKAVSRIQESVRLGTTVSRPMTLEPLFPTMVTNMISVGENAGSLESMLSKIADFYDADIEATTAQLTALIEPLMIAFIGLIIGGMIITLYLPIFTIFSVIR
jgi:type IV pilus assembly protein PilC